MHKSKAALPVSFTFKAGSSAGGEEGALFEEIAAIGFHEIRVGWVTGYKSIRAR